MTPLMVACLEGHARVVELLIAAKADIEGRSQNDTSPLMLAASRGQAKCVSILLRTGTHVNAKNKV